MSGIKKRLASAFGDKPRKRRESAPMACESLEGRQLLSHFGQAGLGGRRAFGGGARGARSAQFSRMNGHAGQMRANARLAALQNATTPAVTGQTATTTTAAAAAGTVRAAVVSNDAPATGATATTSTPNTQPQWGPNGSGGGFSGDFQGGGPGMDMGMNLPGGNDSTFGFAGGSTGSGGMRAPGGPGGPGGFGFVQGGGPGGPGGFGFAQGGGPGAGGMAMNPGMGGPGTGGMAMNPGMGGPGQGMGPGGMIGVSDGIGLGGGGFGPQGSAPDSTQLSAIKTAQDTLQTDMKAALPNAQKAPSSESLQTLRDDTKAAFQGTLTDAQTKLAADRQNVLVSSGFTADQANNIDAAQQALEADEQAVRKGTLSGTDAKTKLQADHDAILIAMGATSDQVAKINADLQNLHDLILASQTSSTSSTGGSSTSA